MKTKILCSSILCCVFCLLTAQNLRGQDLSKYRTFSLGTSLVGVVKNTDQKLDDVKIIHVRPALIQELTWWPRGSSGTPLPFDGVEHVLFSFEYDRTSTDGLTAVDMVGSISKKYGAATSIAPEMDLAPSDRYQMRQKNVASWEDAQYSFNLVRSTFTDRFELIIYSKRVNASAELATTEAIELEKQEGPKREAERQKKDAAELEVTRQKNQKSFRP